MKLTVLGCYGPYPDPGFCATSGYLYEEDGVKIVLDMGAGTLTRLLAVTDIREIDAVYISHLHFDHTSDFLPFRYLLDDLKHDITVYTQYEDSEYYRTLFTHERLKVVNIDENTEIEIKGKTLSFGLTRHPATNYAVKIKGQKTFLYTGDTKACDNLFTFAKDADIILADCAKPRGYNGPHLACEQAIKLKEQNNATLIVTHFLPGDDVSTYYCGEQNVLFADKQNIFNF